MQGIKLTQQQVDRIDHIFISSSTFISIVKDVNNEPFLFLSADDKVKIENTELSYLLDISLSDYVPKVTIFS